MSIGMTYDQYWLGDVWSVRMFLDANERKKENDNYNAWLNGLYVYNAVSSSLGAAFAKKGAAQKIKYVEHPYPFTDREKKQEKIRKIKHTLDFIKSGKNQK